MTLHPTTVITPDDSILRGSGIKKVPLLGVSEKCTMHEPCLLWKKVENLLFPRGCAGCALPDEVLCERCSKDFERRLTRTMPPILITAGRAVSCAQYSGCARNAVLRWKDHADLEAGEKLCNHLERLTQWMMVQPWAAQCLAADTAQTGILIVPAPSSAASRVRRGRLQTMELAYSVSRGVAACGVNSLVVEALRLKATTRKSVQTKGRRDRQSRSSTGVEVVKQRLPGGHTPVILVDDICTTGSTLLSCARSLRDSGLTVIGALTLATVLE